jgi:hypothetical protein
VPVAYRQWVKQQHGGVDLLGLQLKKGRPPSLSAIYVPQISTAPPEPEEPSGRKPRGHGGRTDREALLAPDRERYTLALARLAGESLYVSGAPGTGKSTFCRWVTWLISPDRTANQRWASSRWSSRGSGCSGAAASAIRAASCVDRP